MNQTVDTLVTEIGERFGNRVRQVANPCGEATFEVAPEDLVEVAFVLRDEAPFNFEQLMDLAGVDYLAYGRTEWETHDATRTGFSRGRHEWADVEGDSSGSRFYVVYHLLSVTRNHRLRLKVPCPDTEPPVVDSVYNVWNSANWFEREAFDLFGIIFNGHPDLRRILTDYGFVGHPFRKDFPLSGHVEVRYDPERGRVMYQPVSITPRVTVPKVIREDNQYEDALKDSGDA